VNQADHTLTMQIGGSQTSVQRFRRLALARHLSTSADVSRARDRLMSTCAESEVPETPEAAGIMG
jgi:hypothetical protein